MIDITEITFRNFFSYGDYDTTIKLDNLGPCLITGTNGAGKSTIINAILYGLFGRTMHGPQPGDHIINESSGKGCLVSIKLKNGDKITRTRKLSGHNELIVERNGEIVLTTLSTSANQQAQLNRLYNLDWHTFCNTSFLTQLGRPWFEMPEPQRKKEIERALRIDLYNIRAQIAKNKLDKLLQQHELLKQKQSTLRHQVEAASNDLADTKEAQASFESERLKRFNNAIEQARHYKKQYDNLNPPDINKLRKRWAAIEQANELLNNLNSKATKKQAALVTIEAQIKECNRKIQLWHDRSGRICRNCEQVVADTHVSAKIEPIINELDSHQRALIKAKQECDVLKHKIHTIASAIDSDRPELTVREAEAIVARRNNLHDMAVQWADQAKKIKVEASPHAAMVSKLEQRIASYETELNKLNSEIDEIDVLMRHYAYIHRSYHDRKRIKSFSVARFRPSLNQKLRYYLDKLGLPISFEITDSLDVISDGPSYKFISGGERKRVDVAFMLARFDVHKAINGRQSNIIVLDEVDSRMDDDGVRYLVDIIMADLVQSVDTILVISHKKSMKDIFPRQISVEKHGKFSKIVEVR